MKDKGPNLTFKKNHIYKYINKGGGFLIVTRFHNAFYIFSLLTNLISYHKSSLLANTPYAKHLQC